MDPVNVVRLERRAGVAVVTLTRPDRMNAINRATLQELDRILTALDGDPAVGAIVVTGAGPAFSAGADITELAELDGPDEFARFLREFTDVLARLEEHPTPSIAAIDGVAFGGGLELALACDLRVASDAARLGVPEVKLGLLPGAGGSQRLPRLLPPGVALHMLLTGAPLGAIDAHRLGLVNVLTGEEPALAGLSARIAERILPEATIFRPVLDDVYDLSTSAPTALDVGHRRRLTPEAVVSLDWHNDMSKLILDINEEIERAADDRARGVVIRRLRRALEDKV